MDINSFRELPIMGILRGIEKQSIDPVVENAIAGGLTTLEITMNTPGARELIQRATKTAKKQLAVGAGTVLTKDELALALDAGATFIVLPILIPEIVETCAKNKIPVFPGALTPQEIYTAWEAGATMVKVFPAKIFGPSYSKEVKGPFPNIKLLACGGVTAENIHSFFSCGASAVAFGSSVFRKDWIKKKKFSLIAGAIKELVTGFKNYKNAD
jgi:2-dehydro-3-deoxyphosphogluconate aldolase/(4S)-4-hydroxy-2-oxoglutarate aldolase